MCPRPGRHAAFDTRARSAILSGYREPPGSSTKGGSSMRSIDIHAHLVPDSLWRTVATGKDWYGTRFETGEGLGTTVTNGKRSRVTTPKMRFTPEERLADMDTQGVDVQVVSIHMPFVSYHLD